MLYWHWLPGASSEQAKPGRQAFHTFFGKDKWIIKTPGDAGTLRHIIILLHELRELRELCELISIEFTLSSGPEWLLCKLKKLVAHQYWCTCMEYVKSYWRSYYLLFRRLKFTTHRYPPLAFSVFKLPSEPLNLLNAKYPSNCPEVIFVCVYKKNQGLRFETLWCSSLKAKSSLVARPSLLSSL